MEILHYTVDLKSLFEAQDSQLKTDTQKIEDYKKQGKENKKELLKHVLPLMHGIFELHNRRCTLNKNSITGRLGFLGTNKIDVDKELDKIVNGCTNWEDNFGTFKFYCLEVNFKVWLHRSNKMVVTRHLGYSMTGVIKSKTVYGESIEKELVKVAQYCAKYQDNW